MRKPFSASAVRAVLDRSEDTLPDLDQPGSGSWGCQAIWGCCLVTGEVDDADAVQSVEHQLDGERREQETEDLLGHEHAALI